MKRFRRLLVRWDKKSENYLAFLHLACGIIASRATGLVGLTWSKNVYYPKYCMWTLVLLPSGQDCLVCRNRHERATQVEQVLPQP
jgi:hypothetical protein